ncbi:hypothetical protein C3747_150g15 [Trypanosoma cruzi]|uniref:Uncharacterized protein n=2 Tax=Trypanosoma cruzi TaxID=5693 RepID=Q4DLK3_TRYCC|nr:hypothetical protein, conserved [Trypanosoma cruzi]EAN93408.1 hypothetical protein, conserved [Trypanosoma cruzi]PWV04470.1 hypothetical protein C3747_150g15 [Trypanosoma cruzi]RNC43380.1 hypothetical protein TcCL_NonESM06943 [Trypanosoma cruzi]|eukprot:XP_815259.1 hypothetical protein [Trypanosoma cruzi strain CL Brener]
MRRAAWWCLHLIGVVAPFSSTGGGRCVHLPADGDSADGSRCTESRPSGPSKTTTRLTLNALSTDVRRLLENSATRFWETPGSVDTVLTILLGHQRGSHGGNSDILHPLLGVEILKGLGFAVWKGGTIGGGGGWARRSGISKEDLGKVARCVLQPLLPHVIGHPRVRSLLPVIVEWLVCISDIPLSEWLPQLSLYLDDFAALKTNGRCFMGPSPGFFLQYMTPKLLHEAVDTQREVSLDLRQVLDRMVQLLATGGGVALTPEKTLSDGSRSVSTSNDLIDCIFWQGEIPLILRNNFVREAYVRLCHSTRCEANEYFPHAGFVGKESQTFLILPVVDDDVFRRLLLRLMPTSFCSAASETAAISLDYLVLVKPLLKLEDPSIIFRFITPLSEFVSVVLDGVFSSPLRLSFNGIRALIYSIIGELQQLQKRPPPSCFSLLPHKPRIHVLKALCDRLLGDAERKLKVSGADATFPGVPLQDQVNILRTFSRAARRLVRAVQTEKTASLLEEGPEGSALQAGGVVVRHNDVTTILRNTAFRVLETSLFRYYDALEKWSSLSTGGDARNNDHVADALTEIEHHAGGRSTFFTARHLLQHPSRHDVTAVIEALRIVAIQALLLRLPECREWLRANFATAIAVAFFDVWHRTMKKSLSCNMRGLNQEEESFSVFMESENLVSWRLLWTMLLLHQSCCSCDASMKSQLGINVGSASICAVFRSLLDLLTLHGTCTEFSSFGSSLPLQDVEVLSTAEAEAMPEVKEEKRDETPKSLPKCVAYSAMGGFSIGGSTTRWELQEELLSLGSGVGRGLWRWLGTPRAVWEVVSAGANNTTTVTGTMPAGSGGHYAGYLLPWTTVAHSRHSLRLYDESGQSAAAASAFDANLSALFQLEDRPVVRVVGLTEEAALFREMAFTPELLLGSGVSVVHPEACRRSRGRDFLMEMEVDDDDGLD